MLAARAGLPCHPARFFPSQPPTHEPLRPQATSSLDAETEAGVMASLLGLAMIVPIAGSIIGIIFGKKAMDQVDESGDRGGGLAQAAVIFGYFGLVTLGLVLIMFVIIIVAAKNSTT